MNGIRAGKSSHQLFYHLFFWMKLLCKNCKKNKWINNNELLDLEADITLNMVCHDVHVLTEHLLWEITGEMPARGTNRAKLDPWFSKISRIEARVDVGDVQGLSTNFLENWKQRTFHVISSHLKASISFQSH